MAILSTILEEFIIAMGVLWLLPMWDIYIPLWLLFLAMFAWAAISIFVYRKGTHALMLGHIVGLQNMVGCKGEVVSRLAPAGMVMIKGELWLARSNGGGMEEGTKVIVVSQNRLELVVRKDTETTVRSIRANQDMDSEIL
jgi:membrane-bound ClpP family serine protease